MAGMDGSGTGGPYARWGRRAFTLVVVLLVLPFALALALPIALINLALFRDPRQILFRQPRVGRDEEVFHILKFRTMRETPAEFDSWKSGADRLRVTPFGRLLRNTHLDELPQLVNVLRGEMDLVGPRPEMVEIHSWAADAIPGFEQRCRVRPGITGLAQITQGYAGMDEAAYAAKLQADLDYIQRLSFRGDLAIVLRTALWMLGGKGWRHEGPAPAMSVDAPEDPAPARSTMKPWPRPVSSPTPDSSTTTPAPGIPSVRTD